MVQLMQKWGKAAHDIEYKIMSFCRSKSKKRIYEFRNLRKETKIWDERTEKTSIF